MTDQNDCLVRPLAQREHVVLDKQTDEMHVSYQFGTRPDSFEYDKIHRLISWLHTKVLYKGTLASQPYHDMRQSGHIDGRKQCHHLCKYESPYNVSWQAYNDRYNVYQEEPLQFIGRHQEAKPEFY